MKKLTLGIVTAALPFLLVWAAFILTAFAFNPYEIFQASTFWFLSGMYWFLWVCIAPAMIIDLEF